MNIKNILIFIIVFVIVLWFQNNDDSKHNIQRITYYDKFKIPVVAGILVILIKDLNYKECVNQLRVFITPIHEDGNNIFDNNLYSNVNMNDLLNKIFIEPPNF